VSDTNDPYKDYKRKPSRLICYDGLTLLIGYFNELSTDVVSWKDFLKTGPSKDEIFKRNVALNSTIKNKETFRLNLQKPAINRREPFIVKFLQDWTFLFKNWTMIKVDWRIKTA